MTYPYYGQWQQFPQSYSSSANHIQNISSVAPTEVQCFYVSNAKDMEKVQPVLNVVYIGINSDKKEIYLRQMNNNGLIDFDTYTLQSGEQQKNDYTKIIERIDQLENTMKGKENVIQSANGSISNENVSAGNVQQSPVDATVQSNDRR